MNDESIDTYQVTVSCRATNEAALKECLKYYPVLEKHGSPVFCL